MNGCRRGPAILVPWVTRHRLGVTGGSYGGFLTNWIVSHTNASRRPSRCAASRTSQQTMGRADGAVGHADGLHRRHLREARALTGRVAAQVREEREDADLCSTRTTTSAYQSSRRAMVPRAEAFGVPSEVVFFHRFGYRPRTRQRGSSPRPPSRRSNGESPRSQPCSYRL